MHMENATSMMMGSCRKRSKVTLQSHDLLRGTLRTDSWTDREELPVLLHPERSGPVRLIHSEVTQKQVDGVLRAGRHHRHADMCIHSHAAHEDKVLCVHRLHVSHPTCRNPSEKLFL